MEWTLRATRWARRLRWRPGVGKTGGRLVLGLGLRLAVRMCVARARPEAPWHCWRMARTGASRSHLRMVVQLLCVEERLSRNIMGGPPPSRRGVAKHRFVPQLKRRELYTDQS